jgi:hypothetical protein
MTWPARAAGSQRHLLVCSDGLWGGLDDRISAPHFPPARAPLREELQRLAERSVSVVGAGATTPRPPWCAGSGNA